MSGDAALRGLISTKPTLKWFIVIGIIITIIGIIVTWIGLIGLGIILLWVSFFIIVLSFFGLLYLWLSDRLLPSPRTVPVTRRARII